MLMEFERPAAQRRVHRVALGASVAIGAPPSAVGSVGRLVGEQLADASIDLLDLAGETTGGAGLIRHRSGANRAVVSMNALRRGATRFARRRPDGCSAPLVTATTWISA